MINQLAHLPQLHSVLDQAMVQGKTYYLVKWKNHFTQFQSWQPIQNLLGDLQKVHNWKANKQRQVKQKSKIKANYQKINQGIRFDKQSLRERCLQKKQNSRQKSRNRKDPPYINLVDDSSLESGFKIIGKVNKYQIKTILCCFQWQDNKICQVLLKDGRSVNMRRDDVMKICPKKLFEYYDKDS